MPSWTPERVELLKLRVQQGLFRAEIARELGTTRNAVISKINRLGLGRNRDAPAAVAATRSSAEIIDVRRLRMLRSAAKNKLPEVDYGAATLAFDRAIPTVQRRSFTQLKGDLCRWPVGDPQYAGFFFCGGKAIEESSYCAYHTRRSYLQTELEEAA